MPIRFAFHRIAGLAAKVSPTLVDQGEAGVLVRVDTILDQVGEHPDVGLPRRWKEDCRSYRLRLQIWLQQEIIRREHYEQLLNLLLATERRP